MKYLLFVTKKGLVKKTDISEYQNIRSSGLIAIKLDRQDELLSVHATSGQDQIMLATAKGKAIRFSEKEVRATSRATRGVVGIKTGKDDFVIAAEVIAKTQDSKNLYLLVVSDNGFGKMTPIEQYKKQGRGGKGIYTAKITQKTGPLVSAWILEFDQVGKKEKPGGLLIASRKGQIIRLKLSAIPVTGRQTQGVHLIRLNKGDAVASITPVMEG